MFKRGKPDSDFKIIFYYKFPVHVTSCMQVYVKSLYLWKWCLTGLCVDVSMFILNNDNGIDQYC